MIEFKAKRLVQLIHDENRADFRIRHAPVDTGVAANPMRVGARMLDLFGVPDTWLPNSSGVLPPYGSHVCTIPGAFVASSAGIVGLRNGEVIEDTLDHSDPERDDYERRFHAQVAGQDGQIRAEGGSVFLREPRRELSGRHLSLLLGNHDNYFHWLLMSLARLALLEPDDLSGLDGILMPASLPPAHRAALKLARVAGHAPLITVPRGETLSIETLVLPWNIASGFGVNPIAVSYLRRLAATLPGDRTPRPKRKIYIDRQNAPGRRLVNEAEIVDVIRKRGFIPIKMETLSFEEQACLVRESVEIVGPHGAGLTNIVFANPGARVIELMPFEAVNWCYRHLAAACRHEYDAVFGKRLPASTAGLAGEWSLSPTYLLSALP